MTTEQESMTIRKYYHKRKHRKRLERLWWAVVLIWAGLVLAADSLGLVPQIGHAGAWTWIFLGAGLASILGSIYRLSAANVPNPTTWDWFWGGICLIAGLGGFFTHNIFWPLLFILAGALTLVRGLRLRA